MSKLLCALLSLFVLTSALHAESGPHWVEVRSGHFIVVTDSNEKEARHLADEFEKMRALFHRVLPGASSDAAGPITVVAPKDRKGMRALLPTAYLQDGSLEIAGLFLRTQYENYILVRLDAQGEVHPFSTVYHEYTHFVLRKTPHLPVWLNEGLAQFYQNTDIGDKDVTLGQPAGDEILFLRQTKLIPLPVLFAVTPSSPYYHDEDKGSILYAESWALTHMLEVNDFENKKTLIADYAKFLKQGEDPLQAAKDAFGDLKALQEKLEDYIVQSKYGRFHVASPVTPSEATFKLVPATTADTEAIRGNILAATGRREEAKALIEQALKSDPASAEANAAMGSLCISQNDLECAKQHLAKAVAANPDDYLTHYFFAESFLRGSQKDDEAIQSNLRAAIKLSPAFAPSYDALARYFNKRDKELDEAYTLEITAIQLEPQQLSYRLVAAQIQVNRNQPENAVRMLEAALTIAKTLQETEQIRRRIEQAKEIASRNAPEPPSSPVPSVSPDPSEAIAIETVDTPPQQPKDATSTPKHKPSSVDVVSNEQAATERIYPTATPNAPHHTMTGVLHSVSCSYPTVWMVHVAGKAGTKALFAPNYFRVNFTPLNVTLPENFDPCKDVEGLHAVVDYVDVKDKELSGQVFSVELSK